MHDLIYYPGFEVRDSNWLKFALLYLDSLQPIVPYEGDAQISDRSRRVQNETDLITPHRPTYEEGDNATRDAIEHLEKVLHDPVRYDRIFGGDDYVAKWRLPESQTSTLFRDKYTDHWERFCTSNGIGHHSAKGLRIPSDVISLYMTILAQTIGDANAVSPITDRKTLDRFSIFTRHADQQGRSTVETAQGVFQFVLPENLSELSLERVIEHRNKPGFRDKQKAFHTELNAFMDSYGGDKTPQGFVDNLGSIWNDFSDEVISCGAGAVAFGLGVWLLVDGTSASYSDALQKIGEGLAFSVGSVIPFRNTWTHSKTKRYTRKFVSDLKQLSPVSTE